MEDFNMPNKDIKEMFNMWSRVYCIQESNKYCCRECERDASRKREAKRKESAGKVKKKQLLIKKETQLLHDHF